MKTVYRMKKFCSAFALFIVLNVVLMSCPLGVFAEETPSPQAVEDESLSGLYDEVEKTAALFESVGIDPNTLVTILNLAEKPDGFYPDQPVVQSYSEELSYFFQNAEVQPFEPIDPNQVMPLDGSMYDGNPPYTVAEQQERLEYIQDVFEREYSAERYQPITGRYLAYLYTSHYIENINFDRTKTPSENFDPVFANIIGSADIEAFDTFFSTQQNAAILGSFTSIGSLISSIKETGVSHTVLIEGVKLFNQELDNELTKTLKIIDDLGLLDTGTTTIADIYNDLTTAFLDNYDDARSAEQLIEMINNQMGVTGEFGLVTSSFINMMKIATTAAAGSTIVAPVVGGLFILFDQLSSTISTTALGGLYYSYPTRKQLRLAIYYGVSQRP